MAGLRAKRVLRVMLAGMALGVAGTVVWLGGWRLSGPVPGGFYAHLAGREAFSLTAEVLAAGHYPRLLALLLLPLAVGLDLLFWTAGLAAWRLVAGASWPGAALATVLQGHPVPGLAVILLAGALGGAVLCLPVVFLAGPSGQRGPR